MKLFIITEGSENSGLGHLYRVKSFAAKCQKEETAIFRIYPFISNDLLPIFIDFQKSVLPRTSDDELIQQILNFQPDFILFDLLQIDDNLFDRIKDNRIKTVSLSPIFNKLEYVDFLFTRGTLEYPKGPKVFSGLEYVIIGNHVKRISEEVYKANLKEEFLPIAVTLGGTDAPNKTMKVLQSLVKYSKRLQIWVLLGEGYRHSYTKLVNIIKENPLHEIILARTNQSMWNILKNTTLAITAGGITAFEAAAAGLPTINIVANQQHLKLLNDIIINDIAFTAGVFPLYDENKLLGIVDRLYSNKNQLMEIHKNTKPIAEKLGNNLIYKELSIILNTPGI